MKKERKKTQTRSSRAEGSDFGHVDAQGLRAEGVREQIAKKPRRAIFDDNFDFFEVVELSKELATVATRN